MSGQLPSLRDLIEHRVALGLGVTLLRGAQATAVARQMGCDWLFIDLEHGLYSIAEAGEICMGAAWAGVTPIVRSKIDDLPSAARLLDNGCGGIVVPRVRNESEARTIVKYLRTAPLGQRGMGGSGLGFERGRLGHAEGREAIDRRLMLVATIEDPEGVANVDRIASVEGIDALLLGASDLSFEYGVGGQIEDPRIWDAARAIAAACRNHRRFFGAGGIQSPQHIADCVDLGARLILTGMDHGFLSSALADRVTAFRAVCTLPPSQALTDIQAVTRS
jgi:2-keto-3-deoxy-L-rhamnonate aldolase RhmA